ncbi:uncharacterized protein LOC142988969 [Genypterus blacodes]|uniref:uncharacterized protein LOC142988969 n=1 Tax=Genypterus blacodes TaxID=154954 RepID=UPI003F7674AB
MLTYVQPKAEVTVESCSRADREASTLPHSDTHSHSAAMQEGHVTCASVQFKNSLKPPAASASASASAAKMTEEAVYDDVKDNKAETGGNLDPNQHASHGALYANAEQTTTADVSDISSHTRFVCATEGKAAGQSRCYQILAWCAGSLCVLLLLAVIRLVGHNNQMLKATNINFTKQIEKLQEEKRELTFTVAQETIDDYCPKTNRGRQCVVCPDGWLHNNKSCYRVIDALDRSWEEGRQDCRRKNSDLAVIESAAELAYMVSTFRWFSPSVTRGSWIGLEVSDGSWKWVDGTPVDASWLKLPPPVHAHCGYFYLQSPSITTGSCDRKQRWICEKKSF